MEAVRATFNRYDSNQDGCLTAQEFQRLTYDLGYHLSPAELQMDLKMLDIDGNNAITYDEYITWWKREDRFKMLQIDAKKMSKLQIYVEEFKKYDTDTSGSIDIREFKNVYMDLVKRKIIVKKSLVAAMQDLDTNHDGKISFNEYVTWSLEHCDPDHSTTASRLSLSTIKLQQEEVGAVASGTPGSGVLRSPSRKIIGGLGAIATASQTASLQSCASPGSGAIGVFRSPKVTVEKAFGGEIRRESSDTRRPSGTAGTAKPMSRPDSGKRSSEASKRVSDNLASSPKMAAKPLAKAERGSRSNIANQ
ncbi:hypothetical protein BC830DRAFT_1171514 [Chytriomyces sp. MP71]|nr:hypothetical protein BC830DRAFT_1171514 [Chytriomyces sp. MP71]